MEILTNNSNKDLVFLKSIPRRTATLIGEWRNPTSDKKMNKTKVGDAKDGITALYSPRVGGLLNGLSYKPWMENAKQKIDSTGKSLTLQQKMEAKWGTQKDFLHNRPWGRADKPGETKPSYYQTQIWKLNDGSTALDLNTMDGELGYYVMLDSKYVANSEKELQSRKWPHATHYIALKNESEEIKYTRTKEIRKAIAALEDKKMTDKRKKQFAWILDLAKSTTELTEETVDNLLYDYITQNDFNAVTTNIDKFNDLYELTSNDVGRKELDARLLLKQALDTRVIYEKGETYTWNRPQGTIVLGERYTEAVDFLLSPKKEGFVDELKQQLKAKTIF